MLFQIFFTLFVLLAIAFSLRAGKAHRMSLRGRIAWVAVWLLALGIVLTPDVTNYLAVQLGIGRGVDVVLYSTIPVLFFLLFRLHIKLSAIESTITTLVRDDALKRIQK